MSGKISNCRRILLSTLLALLVTGSVITARAEIVDIHSALIEKNGNVGIEYRSGETLVSSVADSAPAGVELQIQGKLAVPVQFHKWKKRGDVLDFNPVKVGSLTFHWRIQQKNPSLIERTLEVTADAPQKFAVTFPLQMGVDGEFESFTGPEKARVLYDTGVRERKNQVFPAAMLRTSDHVFGIISDSPGLWENRCQVLLDPPAHRIAVLTGDGGDPFTMLIKPPEDARDTYQYQMDGWQSLAAGETRRFTTWVFASPSRNHYDAQVAMQLAVANAKGWNSSSLEAILRNTAYYLLRRNLMRDENNQPRDGKYIFISGMTYGWKQWVSTGIYAALGLNDPEKMIESYRAVFWNRMDYEDNAQLYLIWAVLTKRAGGQVNESLVRRAYEFLRRNEKDGFYIPPPLRGSPHPLGWKTYMDQLHYDDDDAPASNQGFHCGALMAAKELGLPCTEADIQRAIDAYQKIFNVKLGFMPTSFKQKDILGQDTFYGATLTYAVFGRKTLTDEQVLTHYRTTEKIKPRYGLRVISAADGSLLPGHNGAYCQGGSWFFCDSGNYLLAGVHGLPRAEVDVRLIERIKLELINNPAFNEDINTVTGEPHGNTPYADYSLYLWLRKEIRKRLHQTGDDPVAKAIDAQLGVVRDKGYLRFDPSAPPRGANSATMKKLSKPLIGYTELQTDRPGGRFANITTMRAMIVTTDGKWQRELGAELRNETNTWTQFAGWSPDGKHAVVVRGWEDPENGRWEEEHKDFRFDQGQWLLDSCLVELATGKSTNLTAVERVSNYNGGFYFKPNGRELGFTPLINGVSKPFVMDLDGRNKRDLSSKDAGFTYGYSSSPDGKLISFHEDYQVFIANADGSGKNHIATGHPFNFGPSWSKDGEWLMFVSGVRGHSNPYVVRRDGTGLRQIGDLNGYQGWILFLDVPDFHEGSSDMPVWSADGKSVFYTALVGKNVELFQATLDGKIEQLTKTPEGTLHYHPAPSSDGKLLMYGSKRAGVRQVFVMRLADHHEQRITDLKPGHAAMWPHWQPVTSATD